MFKKVRRIGKQWAVNAYNACFNRAYGQVLMLHRVGPKEPDRLPCLDELRVDVDRLQRFVDSKRADYDFVTLDEVYERISHPSKRVRPFICFTLDDGYRDNLTEGLPFFEQNAIPFAVFLTTDFINRHPAFNYPFIMERVVRDHDELWVDGQQYICQTIDQKNAVFAQLKNKVLDLPYEGFEPAFETLFANYVSDETWEDLTMDWEEVRQLVSSPLCTIGSHTVTHCRLSNVPKEKLAYELGESKRQIEEKLGKSCDYVSYPYGWTTDVNAEVFDAARHAGYKMGLVSHGGGIRKNDADLFGVKRIMFTENE